MKITDKTASDTVPYNTVKRGQVFAVNGDYWIKTHVQLATAGGYYSIRLRDGEGDVFLSVCEVRIVEAELTVK